MYYKVNNVIYLRLLLYSSYIIQFFDIDCFNNLKHLYNMQIDRFIEMYINYISKIEFLIVFKIVYQKSITIQNIKVGFRKTGLILFDFETVFSKLYIKNQLQFKI